jgi:uncharacterized repeat protein (TIGR01451 family)
VQPRLVGSQTISQTAFINKNLTLAGGYDANFNFVNDPNTTLDAQRAGRVAVITNAVTAAFTKLNLISGNATGLGGRLAGGDAGGAVYNFDGTLRLSGSVITGNQASYGGGLYQLNGSLALGGSDESQFTSILSNTAAFGGGVYLEGGVSTLERVAFNGNLASQHGGGLYNVSNTAVLTQTAFYSNTVNTGSGGGVYNTGMLLDNRDLTVAFNSAASSGGGFYNAAGAQLGVERSLVLSNTANTGGGLYNAATGILTTTNTIFAFNQASSASGDGAGLYNLSTGLTLRHDTFYANNAGGQGGGIYHNAASGLINSTLIVSNTASSGGSAIHSQGAAPTFDYNNLFNNAASGFSPNGTNRALNPTFIGTDPASSTFLRLPSGSPVEDQGDPTSPILVDIDNDPRPSNLNFDIGADEVGGCYVRINGNPPTYGNIQRAVDVSGPGDVIRVAGICSGVRSALDGGATISQTVFLTKSLTIQGGYTNSNDLAGPPDSVANPTILDALNLGRVAYITNSATITIDRIQLRQGQAGNGGAVLVGNNSVLTMTTSSVYSSTATTGGGLYYQGSRGMLNNVQVYSNAATQGGGLYDAGTGLVLSTTLVASNTAYVDGGGIYNVTDNLLLQENSIFNNQAGNGGGIYNNTGQMTLHGNRIYDNEALNAGSGRGGGFFNNNSATILDRGNYFYNNNADNHGGAIYNNNGNLTVWNNFIYENTSSGRGAGIYHAAGDTAMLHNTFYQNSAADQGGAIYVNGGNPVIRNNIFDQNTAASGSAVASSGAGSLGYNDYSPDAAASQVFGVGVGSNNQNSNPPGFANPAQGDFHLLATSPLIDQAETPGVVLYDFEDDPRPINAASDIGADEYNSCLAQVVSSGTVYGRIQTALNNAAEGDTIRVAQGVCQEGLTISRNVTIIGSWLPDFSAQVSPLLVPITTIDAIGSGNRVITVTSAVASAVNLSWLRLTNGNTSGNGGGILSQAPALNLANMTVISNTAANGGGIYLGSGNATLIAVAISGNQASNDGGGLYVGSGVSAVSDGLVLDQNTAVAGNGGGMYSGPNSNVDSTNDDMTRNIAGGNGGALYNDTGSQVNISGGLPIGGSGLSQPTYGNQAGQGGGVYNNSAAFTLFNKQVNNNLATTGNGGGIFGGGTSVLDLTNLGLYRNAAQSNGGGLYLEGSSSAAFYHATIHQNEAQTGQGGGVYNTGSSMVISASIVAFNTSALGGSGVHGAVPVNVAYTMRESSNTYVGVNASAGTNIDGGDPFIREPGGDLLNNSPAIDAVPTVASHVPVDRFLEPRPQLCAKDMGRDEFLVGARVLTWGGPTPASAVLTPTASVTYTYTLVNLSENWSNGFSRGPATGYTETLTLTLNSSQSWGQLLGISGGVSPTVVSGTLATVQLGPGQTASISFTVTVPPGTLADKVDSTTLSYQAYQCLGGPLAGGSSPAATTNVIPDLNFAIGPDNFGAALPGQTLTYTHILTNLGNLTDTYTLVPGPGLYASAQIVEPISGTITLSPAQTSTVVISVTINSEAAGGLPIPDTTSAIAISNQAGAQKAAADNSVISYTAGTRYVSLIGSDSLVDETELAGSNFSDNNCTQPDVGACRTIQQAVDQAAAGDLIKIDQGSYDVLGTDILTQSHQSQVITQVVFVNQAVMLQGGHNRDDWSQDPPNHISQTTTIDPQGLGRGIYITATGAVTIDRLTLVNGSAAGLGGGPGGQDAGGNLYNEETDLTLNANRIANNNSADLGGGLYSSAGQVRLTNNLLHGNQALNGGAVYLEGGGAALLNNTFVDNAALEGAAVYAASANLGITNTIVATSSGGGAAIYAAAGTPALDYNLYFNNPGGDTGGTAATGSNDLFTDPSLAAPADIPPNLRLLAGSPALDQGDPTTSLALDYDNDPRPLGVGFDIGADERVPLQNLLFYPDTVTTTLVGSTVVVSHTLENLGDITDTFTISAASSLPWPVAFEQPLPYTITLGTGLTGTVTVTYTVPPDANGQTNRTAITATSSLTTVFGSVTDVITVSSAIWEIGKTVSPTPTVQPGDSLTYTIYLTNTGDLDSGGVYTITDPLPANTNFVSASGTPVLTSPNVTWVSSTPVVSNGGVISFTYVVTVTTPLTDGTLITNQDYTVSGGGAYTQASGAPVTVIVESPATLNVSKTASSALVQPGDYLTYTITITNEATALGPALGVVVSDTLPAEVIYQSMGFMEPATGTITATGNPTLVWQLTSPITGGETAQLTVTGRVNSPLAAPATLTNTFSVSASNILAPLTGSATTPLTATNDLILTKTVVPTTTTAGSVVTYTITLTNSGNGLAGVTLTDTLPAGFSPPSYSTSLMVPGRNLSDTVGVASVSFTATTPLLADVYFNPLVTATFEATSTTLTNTAPVTTVAPIPALSLSKGPASQTIQSGDPVVFTFTVTNTGEITLTNVQIGDPVAPVCSRNLPDLGLLASTAYTCTVLGITADLTNTAVATGTSVFNNQVATATAAALVDIIGPAVTVDKTPDSQLVQSGGTVTFTITVSNTGDADLSSVSVVDPLAPACDRAVGSLTLGNATVYTCTLSNVTAGFTNTALVTATPPVGNVVTDSDTAVVSLVTPTIAIAKTPDSQQVRNGDAVTFTIRVTNTGNVDLTSISVDDPLVPACTNTLPDLGPGANSFYTCALPSASSDFTNTAIVSATPALSSASVITAADTAVVDVLNPALDIAKTPDNQLVQKGTFASFNITVSNIGDTTLAPVVVSDPLAPICSLTFVSLAAGTSQSYFCGVSNVTSDFTNTVVATGTPPIGPVVTATDTAPVSVITPAIAIAKTPNSPSVRSGGVVTFTIAVTNTGDAPLSLIAINDVLAPACNNTLSALLNGASSSYTCTVIAGTTDFTNTVVVTGTPPIGANVTASATAFVDVLNPAITLTKLPASQTVLNGSTVTFTLQVTNTGDVTLTNVTVVDPLAPACDTTLLTLAAGAGQGYNCTVSNVITDFVNTAVVTGTPLLGAVVTATGAASVTVEFPVTGLSALNSSPTQLGQSTTFTATVSGGNNVVFSWEFGNGANGTGPLINYTYPATGTYTALVTASNSVSLLTQTTIVTITDVPLSGLQAFNNGPTIIGNATTLSATVLAGSNVVYTWAFGDGASGSGSPLNHTYSATGTYTALVTASNSINTLTATTTVTVTEASIYVTYLPVITKNFAPPSGPDLVVTDITLIPVSGNTYRVRVTAANQGDKPVTYGNNFYVNLYLDGDLNSPALVWGVQAIWFGVGQGVILESNYTFGSGSHTLQGWADPFNTVVETNEANNIFTRSGVIIAGAGGEVAPQQQPVLPSGPLPTPTMTP